MKKTYIWLRNDAGELIWDRSPSIIKAAGNGLGGIREININTRVIDSSTECKKLQISQDTAMGTSK